MPSTSAPREHGSAPRRNDRRARSRRALFPVLAASLLACGGPPAASQQPQVQPLELALRLGDESLQAGQPLELTLTVTNVSGRPVTLSFPTACQENFLVRRGTELVWELAAGRMCAQVMSERVLQAGETVTYATTWNQSDNDGTAVPPGDYEAVGQLLTAPPGSSPAVSFSISQS